MQSLDKKQEGEITVFLSLIFLLLLSVIGTVVEGSRICADQTIAKTALRLSLESAFSKYQPQIWDRYHLLMLWPVDEKQQVDKSLLEEQMSHDLHEILGQEISQKSFDLLGIRLKQLEVENRKMMLDPKIQPLLYEAVAYMKYHMSMKQIKTGLSGLDKIQQEKEPMEEIKDTVEQNQQQAKTMAKILDLVRVIEGISVSARGIVYQRNGKIKAQPYFVKKICNQPISQHAVGIQHALVYQSLQRSYKNPLQILQEIESIKEKLSTFNGKEKQEQERARLEQILEDRTQSIWELTLAVKNKIEEANRILQEILEVAAETSDNQEILGIPLAEVQAILERDGERLERIIERRGQEDWIQEAKKQFSTYEIQNLQFDYRTLKGSANRKNPIKTWRRLIKQGILAPVLDNKKELSGKQMEKQGQSQRENLLQQIFQSCLKNGCQEGIDNIISLWQQKIASIGRSMIDHNIGINKILQAQYITKHFDSYIKQRQEQHVLDYECEYILHGNRTDKENLEDTLMQILLFRMGCNMLYLIRDTKKSAMAYETAVALIGFTCMEPLIQLTKLGILLIWSYEEALVELNGILEKRYLSLVQTKARFLLSYQEIFYMNAQRLRQKAAGLPTKKQRWDDRNYEDMIKILCICQDCSDLQERMGDLIEETMKLCINPKFSIRDCIFGFGVRTEFYFESKFFRFPFMQKELGKSVYGYKWNTQLEGSY